MKEVFTFYNPRARRETCAHFDYRYLMQTARNIAGVMAELHSRGYLIADVSQKNLLVSDAALVTVLDTDSFEFRDPKTNFLHLCNVRTPGFIAPEGYAAAQNDPRAIEEDRFALAVVIFHLLMEGVHPFACKYSGGGEAPRLQQNVAAGRFPYALQLGGAYGPMPAAPPFTMLPATIQNMFERCFVAGHKTPAARPAALEWQKALAEASKNLVVCAKQKHHYYGAHLGADCPWCARIRMGFRDPFPEVIQRAAASGRPSAAPKVSKKASVKAGVPLRKRLLYLALAAFVMFLLAAIFG
jgi:DNA-binding helix-hairpin-helix protein with protein kinase domain